MNSHFIASLARHIQETYDLKKVELTVVFPNKRAAFYLRSKFQEIYKEEIWLPQMLSIEEAMTQWSGIQLIDTVDMLFELIAIDSEIYHQGENIGVFGSMAAPMAKDFDEIDQYNVDARHLFSYVNDLKQIGEWHLDGNMTPQEERHLQFFQNLERYYHLLRERLERQGKGYYGMITRHLASLDDAQLLDCVGHRQILFAGFNALTPTEQTVIDMLYRNRCAEVVWDFDRYYVEDRNNEAGRFARSYIQLNRPWQPKTFSDSLLTQPREIHLVAANGNSIQTKALQSLLQVGDQANAAIIMADEDLLVPLLNSIPDEPRYASLKVSMGYPLRQTSVYHLVNAFFTLHRKGRKVGERGWYVWPILRILDQELSRVIFSTEELEALKRYRNFVAEKSAFVFNQEDFEQHCESPHLRRYLQLLLSDGVDTPKGLLEALVALLAFVANRVEAANVEGSAHFLLNQVSEAGKTVNRLNGIVDRYRNYVNSIADLEVLFRLVSANTRIKLNNSDADGLQIMGLLEARNLDFDTFYMVGVNEGVLPMESSRNSFIPYYIRHECGLPDEQDKQAVYAYHFYRLLQGAKKVYFIYNSNGSNSGSEPSRFLLQLKYELAGRNPGIVLTQESFTTPTSSDDMPERIIVHKTQDLMEKLMQKIQTDHPGKALAPTSLSAYIKCPLLFCLRYLMKIRDNSLDEDTPANVIGSVIHDTLQGLYGDHCGIALTPEGFAADIKPSKERQLRQAIAKTFAQGLPNVGYNYLNRLTIDRLLENFLQYEEKEIAGHTLTLLALEHTLHTTIEVDGKACTLAGKADRIDRRDGVIRIIDYKTGTVKEEDVKVPKDFESLIEIPEKAMQLLIYKYLYLKSHPETDPNTVTAALYGLRQKQVCLDLKVDYEPLQSRFVDTMEALLTEVYRSLMDPTVHFVQPDSANNRPCRFCEFKGICVHTSAGARLEDGR